MVTAQRQLACFPSHPYQMPATLATLCMVLSGWFPIEPAAG